MSGVDAARGGSAGPAAPGGDDTGTPGGLGDFQSTMSNLVNSADAQVSAFITDHTGTNNSLEMSAGESLQLQRLMADESIVANASTGGVKDMADSIKAAARNI